MTVRERPIECILCSVSDGVHAIHALYHDLGETGRQVILPAHRTVPQRLAWVHTVCARGVSSHIGTRGAVYGCYENGEENSDLVHHFVMCGLTYKEEDEEWVKILEEHRKLPCTICGHYEVTSGRNLRVPLQCCAGDKDEYSEFKQHHKDVVEPCTQAMHVGCARWGQKGALPQHQRMWFIPGCAKDQENETEDVVEIFCDLHAAQMGASMTEVIQGSTVFPCTVGESKELELLPYANTTQCQSSPLHSTDATTGDGVASKSVIPQKLKRRRSISEGKVDDADQNDIDGGHVSRQDNLDRIDNRGTGKRDGGMWMDDEAYGIVQGDELEKDPPKGEDPWAYLWKPGAPPFKMELIACAERRNVEGLVKSLFSKKR